MTLPLVLIAQRGCNDMVKMLINSGASLTAKTAVDEKGRGGRTPAAMAEFGCQPSTAKVIQDAMVNQDDTKAEKNEIARKIIQG